MKVGSASQDFSVSGQGTVKGTLAATDLVANTISGGNTSISGTVSFTSNTAFNSDSVFNEGIALNASASNRITIRDATKVVLGGGEAGEFVKVGTNNLLEMSDTGTFSELEVEELTANTIMASGNTITVSSNTSFIANVDFDETVSLNGVVRVDDARDMFLGEGVPNGYVIVNANNNVRFTRDGDFNQVDAISISANSITTNALTANANVRVEGDLTVDGAITVQGGYTSTASEGAFANLRVTGSVISSLTANTTQSLGTSLDPWGSLYTTRIILDEAGNAGNIGQISIKRGARTDTIFDGRYFIANNAIKESTIESSMLANTAVLDTFEGSSRRFGNSSGNTFPVITINSKGQITDADNATIPLATRTSPGFARTTPLTFIRSLSMGNELGVIQPNESGGFIIENRGGLTLEPITDGIGISAATASDKRLKNIGGRIENPLDKVEALDGFKFTFNAKGQKLGFVQDESHVGVSAQEVLKILPEAVDDTGEYLKVHYNKLVPLLIEAVRELSGKVKELEKKDVAED